jgi:hypothetical protein
MIFVRLKGDLPGGMVKSALMRFFSCIYYDKWIKNRSAKNEFRP